MRKCYNKNKKLARIITHTKTRKAQKYANKAKDEKESMQNWNKKISLLNRNSENIKTDNSTHIQ